MTQDHAFEEEFAAALHSHEMPSADFTARVMAQVAKTPQVRAGSSKRTWKIVLTAAACFAVVAVAVPMVFFGTMRAGSAAPESAADCAAPETECAAPAAAEPNDKQKAEESNAVNGFSSATVQETEEKGAEYDAALPTEEVAISDTALCQQAREVLDEMGSYSDSGYYVLTAEQGAALQEALPELKLPTGAFVLVLEG